MTYKYKNLIFLIIVIIFIVCIGIINYKMDPYELINQKGSDNFYLVVYPQDMFSVAIKMTKKEKFDMVIVGSSSQLEFFPTDYESGKRIAYITVPLWNFYTQNTYLRLFLKIHPEVKEIIYPIDFVRFFSSPDDNVTEIDNRLTIKDIVRLLFSIDTTKISINKLYNIIRYKEYNAYEKFKYRKDYINGSFMVNPKRNMLASFGTYNFNIFNEYIKLINEFKEKKLKVKYIILPYNTLFYCVLYHKGYYKEVERIKQNIIYVVPEIMDMGLINKYTSEHMYTTYLYSDIIHPLAYPGNFFYYLINNTKKFKNTDYMVILNKDNVEETISKQHENLMNYIKNNKAYIDDFIQNGDSNYAIYKNYKIPTDIPCEDCK